MRGDFPARAFQRIAARVLDRRRGNHAGDDCQHGADAGEARPQPGDDDGDQADGPADQRCGFRDGESQDGLANSPRHSHRVQHERDCAERDAGDAPAVRSVLAARYTLDASHAAQAR